MMKNFASSAYWKARALAAERTALRLNDRVAEQRKVFADLMDRHSRLSAKVVALRMEANYEHVRANEAEAACDRVRILHKSAGAPGEAITSCSYCGTLEPCSTLIALEGIENG